MRKVLWLLLFVMSSVAMAQNPQSQAPLYGTNAKYTNGVAPGYMPCGDGAINCATVTGMNLSIGPGTANCSGTLATYAGGTLTMTASATNYVYLNTSASCAPAVKTTAFASTDIPIATVVTSGTAITSITDDRTSFVTPGSPFTGGNLTSALVGPEVNGRIDFGANQTGTEIGTMINACLAAISTTTGGICDGSSLVGRTNLTWNVATIVAQNNVKIKLPCAVIASTIPFFKVNQGSNQTSLEGCAPQPGTGTSGVNSGGTFIIWSPASYTGPAISVGSTSGDTVGFTQKNISLDIQGAPSNATGEYLARVQTMDIEHNYFIGVNSTPNTQTLLTLDGSNNYICGAGSLVGYNSFGGGDIDLFGTGNGLGGLTGCNIAGNHFNGLAQTSNRGLLCSYCYQLFVIGNDFEVTSVVGGGADMELGASGGTSQQNYINSRFEGGGSGVHVIYDSGANTYNVVQSADLTCQAGISDLSNNPDQNICVEPFGFRYHPGYFGTNVTTSGTGTVWEMNSGASGGGYVSNDLRLTQGTNGSRWDLVSTGPQIELSPTGVTGGLFVMNASESALAGPNGEDLVLSGDAKINTYNTGRFYVNANSGTGGFEVDNGSGTPWFQVTSGGVSVPNSIGMSVTGGMTITGTTVINGGSNALLRCSNGTVAWETSGCTVTPVGGTVTATTNLSVN